jgi:RNA polymerase sigma-70 factor (ECF subfamily)
VGPGGAHPRWQRSIFLHPFAANVDSGGVTGVRTIDECDVTRLVRQHQDEIWRYLRYLGATAELADDLTQETFLQLLRAPFEDRGEAARSGWLRTVARNLYVRSFRRPPLPLTELDEVEAAWQRFARGDGGCESLDRLRRCVERLDGRARAVVKLHYEERRSRHETGERLGIGEDGVKSLLRRTRALLRDCIERGGDGA